MKKLLQLLLKHREVFYSTVGHRQNTSSANKGLHQLVLDSLDSNDNKGLLECISDPWYRKPLDGVIVCMDVDYKVKGDLLKLLSDKA